jgi:hypothetical protein
MPATAHRTALLAHPDLPGEAVWHISVAVERSGAELTCHYTLFGELARVRVPGAGAGQRADELWQHTCFEVFLAPQGERGYYEFNFSTGLDWAAYHFSAYREGMRPANLARAPGLNVHRAPDRLELTANVHLAGLAALARARRLRVGLATVVEEDSGRLSYWALRHAPGNPDFHHPDSFALEIAGP